MKRVFQFLGVVTGSILLPFSLTAAQSCGDFIYTYDYGDGPEEEREPITDCANPFGLTDESTVVDVTITIAGNQIETGDEILISALPVNLTFSVDTGLAGHFDHSQLARHEGDDYRYIQNYSSSNLPIHATGTYSLVTRVMEKPILVSSRSWWQKLFPPLIPTAYAQNIALPEEEVFVTTFTIKLKEPEEPDPTGASSVLFLPGIQASRLYTDGVLGTEN
jgi:hypothetical protein